MAPTFAKVIANSRPMSVAPYRVGLRRSQDLVEDGSALVWAAEAASWAEAVTRYHEWRGFEPYRPMNEDLGA